MAMRLAVRPVTVNTTIRAACSFVAARTAAVARASVCRTTATKHSKRADYNLVPHCKPHKAAHGCARA